MQPNTPNVLSTDHVLSAIGRGCPSIVLDYLVGGRTYWKSRYHHVVQSIARLGAERVSKYNDNSHHCIKIHLFTRSTSMSFRLGGRWR